jgi:hypothetical protein
MDHFELPEMSLYFIFIFDLVLFSFLKVEGKKLKPSKGKMFLACFTFWNSNSTLALFFLLRKRVSS